LACLSFQLESTVLIARGRAGEGAPRLTGYWEVSSRPARSHLDSAHWQLSLAVGRGGMMSDKPLPIAAGMGRTRPDLVSPGEAALDQGPGSVPTRLPAGSSSLALSGHHLPLRLPAVDMARAAAAHVHSRQRRIPRRGRVTGTALHVNWAADPQQPRVRAALDSQACAQQACATHVLESLDICMEPYEGADRCAQELCSCAFRQSSPCRPCG
jgi:hypothetical protein